MQNRLVRLGICFSWGLAAGLSLGASEGGVVPQSKVSELVGEPNPAQPVGEVDPAQEVNRLYRELRQVGLVLGGRHRLPLPPPTMPDGLDAASQRAILEALPNRNQTVEQFARKSVVSPFAMRFRDYPAVEGLDPIHGIDVWFVAHGSLEALTDPAFFAPPPHRQGEEELGSAKARVLSPSQLKARGVASSDLDTGRERVALVNLRLFDKVELNVAGQSIWTQTPVGDPAAARPTTPSSLTVAARIDRRFDHDPQSPNHWRPILRQGGREIVGDPRTYTDAAWYYKVTPLVEPPGALFIEAHLVYVEPKDWFQGANLLRSKLPIVIQSEIRAFRKRLDLHDQARRNPTTVPSDTTARVRANR